MTRKYYCIEPNCNNIVSGLGKRCNSCAGKKRWYAKEYRKKCTKYHITKEFLIKEYSKNKKSREQIARELGCSPIPIIAKLKKYNIPIRTLQEASKLIDRKGKKAHNHNPERHKKHYCIEMGCNNEISYQTWKNGSGRCRHCACKGTRSFLYIDNRKNTKHYCIEPSCGKEISYSGWRNGSGRCHSCSKKEDWKNPEYREKVIRATFKALKLKPNKPEKLLNKLLQKTLPNEYRYVGDGQIFITGFVPDFFNINGKKKLIELFGDYWHNKPDIKKRDKVRLKTYKKYGYKTLIIWEHELKNLEKVKKKMLVFNNKVKEEK